MFAIDLLKGRGLPEKTNLRRKLMRAAGLVFLPAALAVLAGAWQYDHSQLTAKQGEIAANEKLTSQNQAQIDAYLQSTAHIDSLRKQFDQIATLLCCRIQVTDLFNELMEKLPPEIFFYEIKLDRTSTKEKYQAEGSKEAKQRMVIRRNMTLVLCDFNTAQGDRLVQDYIAALQQSKAAAAVFTEIKPAARQQGMVDDRDATYYYIECTLKEHTL